MFTLSIPIFNRYVSLPEGKPMYIYVAWEAVEAHIIEANVC